MCILHSEKSKSISFGGKRNPNFYDENNGSGGTLAPGAATPQPPLSSLLPSAHATEQSPLVAGDSGICPLVRGHGGGGLAISMCCAPWWRGSDIWMGG